MKALNDPGWLGLNLMPTSLPTVNPSEVDLNAEFLGANLWALIFIIVMNGGHPQVENVNGALASAAEEHKVAIGAGSQCAALIDPELVQPYSIVRQQASDALICGNIGISQIVEKSADDNMLHQLVDMIEANSLAVHINVLQELVQPEGSIELERVYEALANMIAASPVPVIFKEPGCGFDQKTAQQLAQIGAAAIDVGGAGGTSFTQIEGIRATQANDIRGARLAETFASWGISTTLSVREVRNAGLLVLSGKTAAWAKHDK